MLPLLCFQPQIEQFLRHILAPPRRPALVPGTTPRGGFTHNLAVSLPERHKVALSRSRALERDRDLFGGFFSDSVAIIPQFRCGF